MTESIRAIQPTGILIKNSHSQRAMDKIAAEINGAIVNETATISALKPNP
ncbi:hypothetical protein NUKP16_15210 [Klebsiella quasipneumoniae]|nr:hypothetical protein NUKP16_15210 [Klebsiella quasipneumoniae]GKQ02019.1 hypothetical protein NUKP771_05980 [Klebsiella quasipneumoniae]